MDLPTLAEMNHAVKMFEEHGKEAFYDVAGSFGEEIAQFLLVAHLRRKNECLAYRPTAEFDANIIAEANEVIGIRPAASIIISWAGDRVLANEIRRIVREAGPDFEKQVSIRQTPTSDLPVVHVQCGDSVERKKIIALLGREIKYKRRPIVI